jgi:hypothetical protein
LQIETNGQFTNLKILRDQFIILKSWGINL